MSYSSISTSQHSTIPSAASTTLTHSIATDGSSGTHGVTKGRYTEIRGTQNAQISKITQEAQKLHGLEARQEYLETKEQHLGARQGHLNAKLDKAEPLLANPRGDKLKSGISRALANIKSTEYIKNNPFLSKMVRKISSLFNKTFPSTASYERTQEKLTSTQTKISSTQTKLDSIQKNIEPMKARRTDILQSYRNASLEEVAKGILDVTVSSLHPAVKDIVNKMEKREFKDAAIGRFETVPGSNHHTDDNISYSKFLDGEGAALVNTDGEGSRKNSNIYSHSLNEAYQKALILYHEPLTKASLEGNENKVIHILEQIAKEAVLEASEKYPGNLSVVNAASTLGTIISAPSQDKGMVNVMGTFNYDTAIVVWDNEKQAFKSYMNNYGSGISPNEKNWEIYKQEIKGGGPPHFFQQVPKGTLVGVMTDGVLDNLPSKAGNEFKKNPGKNLSRTEFYEIQETIRNEKFESLAKIASNSFFDDPKGEPPGLEFTVDVLPQGKSENAPKLTPEIARNRIMNYTRWVTQPLRDIQSENMETSTLIKNKSTEVVVEIPEGQIVSKEFFESLGSGSRGLFTENSEDKYVAKIKVKANLIVINKNDFETFDQKIKETIRGHSILGTEFNELAQDINGKQTLAPGETQTSFQAAFSKIKETSGLNDPNNDSNFKEYLNESVILEGKFVSEHLDTTKLEITTKTDGVSGGFMTV